MIKPNESISPDRWNGSLNKPVTGRVEGPSQVKDQSNTSVFMGMPADTCVAAKDSLPLFIDTLYKARDFDPL